MVKERMKGNHQRRLAQDDTDSHKKIKTPFKTKTGGRLWGAIIRQY
jgi:hypothetical protein